jgi:hypothetical protein
MLGDMTLEFVIMFPKLLAVLAAEAVSNPGVVSVNTSSPLPPGSCIRNIFFRAPATWVLVTSPWPSGRMARVFRGMGTSAKPPANTGDG